MRVGFVEWPEGLEPYGPEWLEIANRLADAQVEMLITNELPFGPWIADRRPFDRETAQASADAHVRGFDALAKLAIPAILSSRPVWAADRLLNQAVVIESGRTRAIHTKQYFPEEPGWYEASWYESDRAGFNPFEISGLRMGVMLCTDAMFNEHARHYGRQGTVLIAIPRAAGTSTENWLTAGRMAAIVSGNYVVSSNRYGRSRCGAVFGGAGFAFSPDGTLLSITDSTNPLLVVDVNPDFADRRRNEYPCYVVERGAGERESS
ncbi:carbon-nitrogen hydrolase family protein [Pleomorphomonas carboxyditropha]|uniref:carbon-nitrogen hydrolase family protein n=1 Tax=Pleomorphomonas carboxyditropha TaxID=2023338 RepID=UPI001FE09ACB|nr:carbon-nitrogen hydrolase family protein [Pleomorphomonas carboxyditropha]